jgi:hypothetical protein
VELKKQDIYSTFIDKLWRAVCVRLLTEMLEALKDGRDLHFGDALLHDDGITLVKRKFLGSNEKVRCSWGQVHVWSADGSFCIGAKDDKKVNAGISYIHGANTHILEQAIRMAFKKPGMRRLSDCCSDLVGKYSAEQRYGISVQPIRGQQRRQGAA